MPIPYDAIEEGETLDAASLNSRTTAIAGGLNDLELEDLSPGALNSNHLPSTIIETDTASLGTGATHTYTGASYPFPGWSAYTGWANIVQTDVLAVSFSSVIEVTDPTEARYCKGILLLVDIDLQKVYHTSGLSVDQVFVHIVAQFQDGVGTWRTIKSTMRHEEYIADTTFHLRKPFSIRSLITTELPIITDEIAAFRVVLSLSNNGPGGIAGAKVDLGNCQMTAIAFRSSGF